VVTHSKAGSRIFIWHGIVAKLAYPVETQLLLAELDLFPEADSTTAGRRAGAL
jgi:hypothetical protein